MYIRDLIPFQFKVFYFFTIISATRPHNHKPSYTMTIYEEGEVSRTTLASGDRSKNVKK